MGVMKTDIRAAKDGLSRMESLLASFDSRLTTLRREAAAAKGGDLRRLQLEIAGLEADRAGAVELVAEAAARLAEAEAEREQRDKQTLGDLGRLSQAAAAAARQVDEAIGRIDAAVGALEEALEPLARAELIASGRVGGYELLAAYKRGLQSRFGNLAGRESTMAEKVELKLASARQNAARAKTREVA